MRSFTRNGEEIIGGELYDLFRRPSPRMTTRRFISEIVNTPPVTTLAIEEPENNLAPFFLSRVIQQLLDVTTSGRAQAVISSHSASVMSRIRPEQVRHFRLNETSRTTRVCEIVLPDDTTEAGKYLAFTLTDRHLMMKIHPGTRTA